MGHADRPHDDIIRLTRREALAALGRGAGALVVGVTLTPGSARADRTAGGMGEGGAARVGAKLFVDVDASGAVRLTCHRSEMGQQVWTAIAQILADELEADWGRIEIVQAEGHPRYGNQNTDGSRSVRRNLDKLRRAGASIRALLVQAAAEHWTVPARECAAVNHLVTHRPTGRTLGYGALARQAMHLPLPDPESVALKPRAEWRYMGKPVPSITIPEITRGAPGRYAIDQRVEGMLFAVVARPPQVFGAPASVDDAAARAIPGVVRTVRLPDLEAPAGFKPLGGVAVVARDTWSAIRGRRALKVKWRPGPNAGHDSESFERALVETARRPGTLRRRRGDADAALARAARRVEAEYHVPHLAHAPMEPPAATARWSADGKRVEVWGCIQAPQSARRAVATACGVDEDAVTIHVTWLGGGFGRKSKPDFMVEAALVARVAKAPVQVLWTREDDLQHGYLHTVSVQRVEGGLDAAGRCAAWKHRTVFPTISSTFRDGADEPSWGELRLGFTDNPFDVPNLRLESGRAPAHLRIGWLRAVANIQHAFAVQSFAAELAEAAGQDPKDYLLTLIGAPRTLDPNAEGAEYDNYGDPLERYPIDTGRLRHVVEKAAEMAGWGRALPKGHGLGIAAHRSFLTYVATVVEVRVGDDGGVALPGVWSAMDAGTVINPGHAAAQVEGGTLFGLSNALYGRITAKDGRIQQANFPAWRQMRMHEAPRAFETHIVPSAAPPGGVGEPSTPPAAPALTNALAAATGKRFRRLPILGADRSRIG
ncbi:MAG: xanthine dehydrogenase family protein molybdopterin-binding subunit [Planctomycetota bacterium]|jgi:isoquinoline 1-oxidoreductase beta subunit